MVEHGLLHDLGIIQYESDYFTCVYVTFLQLILIEYFISLIFFKKLLLPSLSFWDKQMQTDIWGGGECPFRPKSKVSIRVMNIEPLISLSHPLHSTFAAVKSYFFHRIHSGCIEPHRIGVGDSAPSWKQVGLVSRGDPARLLFPPLLGR